MKNKVLMLLFFGVLMGALDIAIIGPALHTIQDSFQISERLISWMINIYVLFNLIGTPLLAKFSDQNGRKNIYILSLFLFGLGSLIITVSNDYSIVLLGRAIQGLGAGGIFPVAVAVIGDVFPPEERGKKLGLIGAIFGIAFLIGPILGGILLKISWHLIFAINIPISIILMLASLKILPKSENKTKKKLDVIGLLLLIIILTSFSIGINQIDTKNFYQSLIDSYAGILLLISVILLPILITIEKKTENPLIKIELLSNKQILLANFLAFGGGMTESGIMFLPLLAVEKFGVSDSNSSFMLLPMIFALSFGAPTAGRMLDRIGSKLVLLSGTIILAIGLSLLYFLNLTYFTYYLSTILIGFGLSGLLGAPVRYILLNEAPEEERSVTQAISSVFTSVGLLLSASVIGAVAASYDGGIVGYKTAFLAISILAIFLVFISLGLKSRKEELKLMEANKKS